MLRSVFKMDNKDVYGDYFEVKLCTEETNKEDDILSKGNKTRKGVTLFFI